MQLNLEDKSFLCLLDFNLRFPIIPFKYVGRSTWSVMIKVQFSFQIMTTMNPNSGYFMYETSHYMLALCTNHIHLKSGTECIKSGVFNVIYELVIGVFHIPKYPAPPGRGAGGLKLVSIVFVLNHSDVIKNYPYSCLFTQNTTLSENLAIHFLFGT